MKVSELKEYLSRCPQDYDVCLSKYFEFPIEEKDEDLEDDVFSIVFDHPIVGIATQDKTREIRFVCQHIEGEDHPMGKVEIWKENECT